MTLRKMYHLRNLLSQNHSFAKPFAKSAISESSSHNHPFAKALRKWLFANESSQMILRKWLCTNDSSKMTLRKTISKAKHWKRCKIISHPCERASYWCERVSHWCEEFSHESETSFASMRKVTTKVKWTIDLQLFDVMKIVMHIHEKGARIDLLY